MDRLDHHPGQTASQFFRKRSPIAPARRVQARDPERATLVRMSANATARLTALAERVEADPGALGDREIGDRLADEVGGEAALRWRIAVVQALIAAPPDPDAVREAYGELVDRYRDDPPSLARIRPIGDEIRRRESDGSLPSTLVVRSDRRPRSPR